MQHRRAVVSEGSQRERAGQSLPSTYVEEGESMHNLVPSQTREASLIVDDRICIDH